MISQVNINQIETVVTYMFKNQVEVYVSSIFGTDPTTKIMDVIAPFDFNPQLPVINEVEKYVQSNR